MTSQPRTLPFPRFAAYEGQANLVNHPHHLSLFARAHPSPGPSSRLIDRLPLAVDECSSGLRRICPVFGNKRWWEV